MFSYVDLPVMSLLRLLMVRRHARATASAPMTKAASAIHASVFHSEMFADSSAAVVILRFGKIHTSANERLSKQSEKYVHQLIDQYL